MSNKIRIEIVVTREDGTEIGRIYEYRETTDYTKEIEDIINSLEKEF
jgi:hypothetical protein